VRKQIPCGNDRKKGNREGNSNGNSNSNSKGNSNSNDQYRDLSTTLRFGRDDSLRGVRESNDRSEVVG